MTNTTITIEETTIYSSRLINNKSYKLTMSIESVQELIQRCERLASLEDDLYIEFSELQKASEDE